MHDHIPVALIHSTQSLQHPPLNLTDGDATFSDHIGEVGSEKLEHENRVLVLAPEELVQNDHVLGPLQDPQSFNFARRRLGIVHLLQRHRRTVRAAPPVVQVGVGTRPDPTNNLVLGSYLGARVDAPTLARRIHQCSTQKKFKNFEFFELWRIKKLFWRWLWSLGLTVSLFFHTFSLFCFCFYF